MQARDVMMSPVVTAKPYFTIQHVAKLFLEHGISAVPVINDDAQLVGIISEGDLMHRAETNTESRLSWWLAWIASDKTLAETFIKERSRKVADVMTKHVITVAPHAPLREVAELLERHRIKRVPVVENGQLVGIVSRASLIQALASSPVYFGIQPSDSALRTSILGLLKKQPWVDSNLINVTTHDGVVDLWGMASSDEEKKAIRVATESVHGVRAVNDHIYKRFIPLG
jgi:CBS domain-containing protein